jgi:hypothetical protein
METTPRFRTYPVIHNDGTTGRVMGTDGDYSRICYRENGRDEVIEIKTSILNVFWHRYTR